MKKTTDCRQGTEDIGLWTEDEEEDEEDRRLQTKNWKDRDDIQLHRQRRAYPFVNNQGYLGEEPYFFTITIMV